MLWCDWKKVCTSSIWVPILAVPLLVVLIGFVIPRNLGPSSHEWSWLVLYSAMVQIYAIVLLPMVAGILASLCCRGEHLGSGWKQLLALPVSRTVVYLSKFFYTLLFLALVQGLVLVAVLVDGFLFLHLTAPIPWQMLIKGFIAGWIATIPLAALQLWVSTWWKSFGAPFALNIILTIPALAISNSSSYAPIYPWAQPMLAMRPTKNGLLDVTPETMITITIAGITFIIGGWLHFIKRDV
ncbi:ABC transporter permease [Neobacillus jeddahensis]|uniref:ABC transporter permease n=1 Tax=Neobacillus jeddahensis TaxID=1461580 RepID=UPI00058E3591|nr:ABC transporter permease [Neobacillus jeddahensis]